MASRKDIDWEMVEREYRAGQLTVREIARRANCARFSIENKAKKYGWTRDLTDRIRQETKRKVAMELAAELSVANTPEIIDVISERGKGITLKQIERIETQYDLIDMVAKKIKDEDLAGGGLEPRDIGTLINHCTASLSRLISLERQAHNMDDKDPGDDERKPHDLSKLTNEQLDALAEIADTVKPT